MKQYLKDMTLKEIAFKLITEDAIIYDDKNSDISYQLVDSVIYELCDGHSKALLDIHRILAHFYFKIKDEFKITKSGLYRTEDGRKVFISCLQDDIAYGIIEGFGVSGEWNLDGTFIGDGVKDSIYNIISEWED